MVKRFTEAVKSGVIPGWLTDKYIYVMLLLFPLFTGFEGYSAITQSKFRFFAAATALWLIPALVFWMLKDSGDGERPRIGPPQLCVLAFMAVCVVSALASPYRSEALLGAGRYDGLATMLLYGAAFLGVSAFGEMKRGYVFALGISTALCCAVAVLQLSGLNPLWLFPDGVGYYDKGVFYSGEFLGTIGNANLLGAFLCLGIPLCAAGFVTGERKSDFLLLIPAVLGLFVLICSGVSGAAVGTGAGVLLCAPVVISDGGRLRRMFPLVSALLLALSAAILFTPDSGSRCLRFSGNFLCVIPLFCAVAALVPGRMYLNCKRKRLFIIFLCISAACVVGFITAALVWPYDSGTMYELGQVLRGNWDGSFGSSRLLIWREVLALVPERPLLGGGPDTLALRLDVLFSRFVEETGRTLSSYVDNAHNEYLGYLVNVGALGLAAYLAAMAFTAYGLVRRSASDRSAAVALCALVCYWVQGFFGLGLCLTAPVLWVIWGLSQAGCSGKKLLDLEVEKLK